MPPYTNKNPLELQGGDDEGRNGWARHVLILLLSFVCTISIAQPSLACVPGSAESISDQEYFNKHDTDSDGTLDMKEFFEVYQDLYVSVVLGESQRASEELNQDDQPTGKEVYSKFAEQIYNIDANDDEKISFAEYQHFNQTLPADGSQTPCG